MSVRQEMMSWDNDGTMHRVHAKYVATTHT